MSFDRQLRKTELTEGDIEFIVANTGFEREKVLEWFEQFKQKCPNGRLSKPQFIEFYKQLIKGEHEEENEFCEYVFEVFDTDDNGSVDFGEFLIAFSIRAKGSLKEKLSWIFDIYDFDNNEFITQNELVKIFRLVFKIKGINEDPYEEAAQLMISADRSDDEKLTKYEFISTCSRNNKLRQLFSPY